MNEFVIKNSEDFYAKFHSQEISKYGWLDNYTLTIHTNDMNASTKVSNLPYGHDPSDFFEVLAQGWKGWSEKKEGTAMEGEIDLTASHDNKGTIELTIELRSGFNAPCWNSSIILQIDAGGLQVIATDAKHFFCPKLKAELQ